MPLNGFRNLDWSDLNPMYAVPVFSSLYLYIEMQNTLVVDMYFILSVSYYFSGQNARSWAFLGPSREQSSSHQSNSFLGSVLGERLHSFFILDYSKISNSWKVPSHVSQGKDFLEHIWKLISSCSFRSICSKHV